MAVSNQPKHVNGQDLIVCSLYHKERGVKIRGKGDCDSRLPEGRKSGIL
jgi:hypothetical protein